jgi:uncharacterized membrane protein YphA (DoxX/SURF4 family)
MAASKSRQMMYWVLTLLVLLPLAGSGFPELFGSGPAMTVQSLQRLGYPLYLMKITGLAKILGAVVIFAGRPPRLVEWAYAGFAFLLLGATASHLLAGDIAHAWIPLAFFLFLMESYTLRHHVRAN